jgi:leader peptidase (prepilin peptidase)/N-methyltransferase
MLAQSMPLWVYSHLPVAVFIFAFGACVGSFMNVVIYRLPAGMSVISPPSRCPACGGRLSWWENLPILGWIMVRGRCRRCGVAVSPQYMVIEVLMAVLFLGLYLALYTTRPDSPWWGQIGGAWWSFNGLLRFRPGFVTTAPGFIAWTFLLAALVGMTVIDARTFTIPPQIPLVITLVAFIAWPLQALLPLRPVPANGFGEGLWPIPLPGWPGTVAAMGGMLGVGVSMLLLRAGRLRYSFTDYHEYLPPESSEDQPSLGRVTAFELVYALPCVIGIITVGFLGALGGIGAAIVSAAVLVLMARATGSDPPTRAAPAAEHVLAHQYPHARREMRIEIVFLLPCIAGLAGGYALGHGAPEGTAPPLWLAALAGGFGGYLVGAGLVWGIRILGTLAFGREAMGLGDVHLLGAVGAVLGWCAPIWVFFLAPFSGILWALLSTVLSAVLPRAWTALPYGPHLALAALFVIVCRAAVDWLQLTLFPWWTCH